MNNKPKLVVSTGAGVSAESGISTFRDSGGLWEQYDVMEVASHEGYLRNPGLIHRFYNARRRQAASAEPNAAHKALAELEEIFDVYIITQNVDTLHERAGSSKVLHLHGRLDAVEATDDPDKVFILENPEVETSVDTVIDGHHVRPHIVFFGEAVPNFEKATELVHQADVFVIIGTTLSVYPAASLLHYVRPRVPIFYIDPNPASNVTSRVYTIPMRATDGMEELKAILAEWLRRQPK